MNFQSPPTSSIDIFVPLVTPLLVDEPPPVAVCGGAAFAAAATRLVDETELLSCIGTGVAISNRLVVAAIANAYTSHISTHTTYNQHISNPANKPTPLETEHPDQANLHSRRLAAPVQHREPTHNRGRQIIFTARDV